MKAPRRRQPMSLEDLENWFAKARPETPVNGVSMMDGFLTAMVIGPVLVHPDQWLRQIMGVHEARAVAGSKAEAAMQGIVAHYNLIANAVACEPSMYTPIYMRTAQGEVFADDWADGFYDGMKLGGEAWRPVFMDPAVGMMLTAILATSTTHVKDLDYSAALNQAPKDELREIWRAIRDFVPAIRDQCAEARALSQANASF